ncbi:uncharacterized protein LOC122645006 [Telopea speciosissima]|uniref:uncharacterized protein LOC122645006 n=1 Tax=Telopea speciosissima TaxID=54955 RepID=UPI001CC51939|nr:uncharacterized protein LOC122645006 [Telopea speciosissima]
METIEVNDSLFGLEADSKTAYLNALKNSEKLWYKKSRIKSLREGDHNSKFFHLSTLIRRAKCQICGLKNDAGAWVSDPGEVANLIYDFYEKFHRAVPLDNHLELLDVIPSSIGNMDQLMLDAIPDLGEIKAAVWDLDLDSSPGPNGFQGVFFRHCWEIIETDVWRAIINFFREGGLLPRLISEEQGTFQKGKVIFSNICLASELANLMHKSVRGGGIGLKLDILKAYDSLSWDFFFNVLRKFVAASTSFLYVHLGLGEWYVHVLKEFLVKYQCFTGQRINLDKSKLFCGAIIPSRKRRISDVLNIPLCSLPTKYLGVDIFKGRVTIAMVLPLVDKFKSRLSGWKGKLLSLADRVELVKSVMLSISVHNFLVYWWPSSLVSLMEKWIRNFIWAGDIESRKLVVAKWDLLCRPKSEGGLGIRKLRDVSSALLCKLEWSNKHDNSMVNKFLRARYMDGNGSLKTPSSPSSPSSIWPGINKVWSVVQRNERWIIGDGSSIKFWKDYWFGNTSIPMASSLLEDWFHDKKAKFSDIIKDASWSLP